MPNESGYGYLDIDDQDRDTVGWYLIQKIRDEVCEPPSHHDMLRDQFREEFRITEKKENEEYAKCSSVCESHACDKGAQKYYCGLFRLAITNLFE